MYEAFYKLDGKPFRLTPDAGMLFPSKGHTRAMSYLLYGFEQGEGFVMITGPVGTGKTLLIQKLMEDLSHRHIAMASIASANLDGEDILPAVASEFDLPFEQRGKEALLQDLKRHLISLCHQDAHALLVVDEAQTLTPKALEMLRILSNFEVHGRALLQVFLVGQTELRGIMVSNNLEQLRQRIIASYRLEPMDVDESRDYIQHRLHAVGWDNDPELDPDIFAAVHKAGRGIPRKINFIMDRLLLYGYLEELHRLDESALSSVIKEMSEEMADAPQTLEPSAPERQPKAGRAPPYAMSGGDLAALKLQLKYNNALLRLMRDEFRLKQVPVELEDQPSDDDDPQLAASQFISAGTGNE
ncbi:MAG TPA: AAA family ATPase [Oleiagrimonas sp.]|nr:AAA family ATPase [Oleiagrimonas sp.]